MNYRGFFCVIPLRASTALRLRAWFVGERQLFSCAKPARSGGRNHSSTACAGYSLDARLLELERRRNVTKRAVSDSRRVTPISKLSDLRVNSTRRRLAAPEGPDGC